MSSSLKLKDWHAMDVLNSGNIGHLWHNFHAIDVHATDVGEEEKEEKGEKEEKEWPNQLNPPPAGYSHMEMDLWS